MVNFTSSCGQQRSIVEMHAVAQGEVVGQRVGLGPGNGDLRDDFHRRIAHEQTIVHVADDGFGVAVAGIGGIERERVLREADADFRIQPRGRA